MTDGRGRPTGGVPGERRLEAPHRRGGSSPRVVERLAVVAYKATTRLADIVPESLAREVVGTAVQGSYLAWPTKRRWSNRNFGHVLGLPPDDPRVRRLALRAYHEYGRYLVELMRLPTRTVDEMSAMVPYIDVDELHRIAASARGGVIYTVGHVGSNDAVMAAIARHGMPISVVADDSSFPELFELLRAERELRGATVIAWRNLRRDLRRAAPARDAGPPRRLGLPPRRRPGPPLRRLDHPARRSRDARGEDRLADPAGHDPAPAG